MFDIGHNGVWSSNAALILFKSHFFRQCGRYLFSNHTETILKYNVPIKPYPDMWEIILNSFPKKLTDVLLMVHRLISFKFLKRLKNFKNLFLSADTSLKMSSTLLSLTLSARFEKFCNTFVGPFWKLSLLKRSWSSFLEAARSSCSWGVRHFNT